MTLRPALIKKPAMNVKKKALNRPLLKSNPLEDASYIPFSYDFPTKGLPEKKWFEKHFNKKWRRWADSRDPGKLHPIMFNLIASLVDRGEKEKPASASICLAILIRQSLAALHYLALAGRPGAAGTLAFVLREAVGRLNHPEPKNTATMKKVAKSEIYWPINFSPNTFLSTNTKELENRLAIGNDYFLQTKKWGQKGQGKSLQFNKPKNRLALRMIETLMANRNTYVALGSNDPPVPSWVHRCRELPPLSIPNAEVWRDVGWEAICEAYTGHPETDEALRKIGLNRERREVTQSAQEGAIRNEIRTELLTALRDLIRDGCPWDPNNFLKFRHTKTRRMKRKEGRAPDSPTDLTLSEVLARTPK